MWVPGCVSGAGQTSSSPARISHNISPSPLGCGHSLWRGFPHISLSTAPSQVLPRNLGRRPLPEGQMFSAGLAPTLSLISHVNQKSIREGWTAVVRPYLEALGFYKLWEHSYSLHKKKGINFMFSILWTGQILLLFINIYLPPKARGWKAMFLVQASLWSVLQDEIHSQRLQSQVENWEEEFKGVCVLPPSFSKILQSPWAHRMSGGNAKGSGVLCRTEQTKLWTDRRWKTGWTRMEKQAQEAPLEKANSFLMFGASATFFLVKFVHLSLQSDPKLLRGHLPGYAIREP